MDTRLDPVQSNTCQKRRYASVLNDDVVLCMLCKVGLRELLIARLVCKQWMELSFHRSVLSHHYDTAHLYRALGPSHWHTTEGLNGLLLRDIKLSSIIDSDPPQVPHHQVHVLLEPGNVRFRLCGQLLIVLRQGRSLLCSDLDDPEKGSIWSYELPESDIVHRIHPCFTESKDQIGSTVVTIVLGGYWKVMIVKLHTESDSGAMQVTDSTISEFSLAWMRGSVKELEFKQDWILASNDGKEVWLFDTLSTTLYSLELPKTTSLDELLINATFATSRYVVIDKTDRQIGHSVLCVYEIPQRTNSKPQHEVQPLCQIAVEARVDGIHFLDAQTEPSRDSIQAVTTLRFVAIAEVEDRKPMMALMNVMPSSDSSSCKITSKYVSSCESLSVGEYRKHVYGLRAASSIVVKSIIQYPLDLDENGIYRLGRYIRRDLPKPDPEIEEQVYARRIFFDDIRGRVYLFLFLQEAWILYVIHLA